MKQRTDLCGQGHSLLDAYVRKGGRLQCRTCHKAWRQANRAKYREAERLSKKQDYNPSRRKAEYENADKKKLQQQNLRRSRPRNAAQRARVNALKLIAGCVDCGRKDGILDWDHVDPTTKLFSIGNSHHRAWETVQAELAKCEVRCHDCHMRKHHQKL